MTPRPIDKLLLLYAPPIDLGADATLAGERTEWMDLRFTIARDGKVRDVSAARSSERVKPAWVEAASRAIAARRYAPIALVGSETEPQRTERVSFVSDFTIDWRSRTFTRDADRRAVAQDLNGRKLGER